MVDYMYSLEYDVEVPAAVCSEESATESVGECDGESVSESQPINHAIVHVQMYAMGDKYLIPALKDYSGQCFKRLVSTQTGSELANSITEAYSITPESDRGLRDICLQSTETRLSDLTHDSDFSKQALHIPCFSYELLQRTVARMKTREVVRVAGCSRCKSDSRSGKLELHCFHGFSTRVTLEFDIQ